MTTTCEVKSIVEKKGKVREMLIATTEYTYRNQAGACVAKRANTLIRWR